MEGGRQVDKHRLSPDEGNCGFFDWKEYPCQSARVRIGATLYDYLRDMHSMTPSLPSTCGLIVQDFGRRTALGSVEASVHDQACAVIWSGAAVGSEFISPK
jgi:hypothetical protein